MKKFIFRAAVILLIIAAAAAVFVAAINIYVIKTTEKRIITLEEASGFDCILVLGAGVRADGSPSAMLKERLDCAYSLYEKGASGKVLVSGDHGREEYDEVNTMKSYLVEKGVPSEDVFMDHAGFSTYDSLYRAGEIFGVEKVCVVTQKYHLYRSLYLADKLSLDAKGVDAKVLEYYGQLPRDVREAVARVKDFFSGIILPEPKYLGDMIPISGNGDVTNDKDI